MALYSAIGVIEDKLGSAMPPKTKVSELKFISEAEIPIKVKRKSVEWLNFFKQIPEGKALVVTEKELGVSGSAVKTMVARLKQSGQLSSSFYISQRTVGDKATLYIVNSAKKETKA